MTDQHVVNFENWPLFADLRENSREPDDSYGGNTVEFVDDDSQSPADLDTDDAWSERESVRIDAGGERIDFEILNDMLYAAHDDGFQPRRAGWCFVMHPRQQNAIRSCEFARFERAADTDAPALQGIEFKIHPTMPRSSVLLLDPDAIALSGKPIHRDRIVRATGLDPDPEMNVEH